MISLDTHIDARSYNNYVNRPQGRNRLNETINLGLVDTWHEMFPDKKRYTWRNLTQSKETS